VSKAVTLVFLGNAKQLKATFASVMRDSDIASRRMSMAGLRIGQAFRLGFAGIGVAVVAVTTALAYGVKAVIAYQKIQAQTAAVLHSTGGVANVTAKHVEALALQIQSYSAYSEDAVAQTENLLLTFPTIRNEAGKNNKVFDSATRAVLDMATALGSDTRSAAIRLGKALADPARGMTALRRVGVIFTDAQTNVVKKLVATHQTLKAQRLILAEVTKEFGGSAKAAGQTFAGSLARLKNQTRTTFREFATPVLPLLTRALGGLATVAGRDVAPALAVAGTYLSRFSAVAGKDAGPWFTKLAALFRQSVLPILRQVGTFIAVTLVPVFEHDLLPVIKALADFIVTKLAPAIGKVLSAALSASRAMWQKISKTIDDHRGQLTTLLHAIRDVASFLLTVLVPVLKVGVRLAFAIVGTAITNTITVIAGMVTAVRDFLGIAKTVAKTIFDFVVTPLGWIVHAAASAFGWIPGIGGKLKKARADFDSFVKSVNADLSGIKNKTITIQAAYKGAVNVPGTKTKAFALGGPVNAPRGMPVPAILHGGEFVLSTKMLDAMNGGGLLPRALARGIAHTESMNRGTQSPAPTASKSEQRPHQAITNIFNVTTTPANPQEFADEIAWAIKTGAL
jgi:hypothetical protein